MIGTFTSPAVVFTFKVAILISINEIKHRHAVVPEIRNEGNACLYNIVLYKDVQCLLKSFIMIWKKDIT